MSENKTPDFSDQKHWPDWVKGTLRWMGIAAALIGAIALVIAGVGNVWEGGEKLCAAIALCDAHAPPPIPTPTPSKVVVETPRLPDLITDWVGRGHTADEYCNPQKTAYEKQYPGFNIDMTKLADESQKHFLGHVTYRFHCAFVASPK